MADFILEIYSEEIPAGMQAMAAAHLEKAFCEGVSALGVKASGVRAFAAPQRLALLIDNLPLQTEDLSEERKGPRVDAPEKAIEGFLRANGLSNTDSLTVVDDSKGAYYVLSLKQPGMAMSDVIATLVPQILRQFPWPKSMRWGSGSFRWVRPLRAILCRLDGKIIAFDLETVQSSGVTYGHRFMAPEAIEIERGSEYVDALQNAKVIVDPTIRAAMIGEGASLLCSEKGFELVEDAALIRETAGLVEWPVPLMGRIDDYFMSVPDELLTSVMRTHQKYFSVRDPKTGELAPYFVTISNMETADAGATIIAGNERVLRARLSDGKFFWDQDRKTKLADRISELDKITFHAKLGTVGQKAQRISSLAGQIASDLDLNKQIALRAGLLCKADLVSGVVFEFPELQGIMGGYYADHDQEELGVGAAIKSHYAPLGPSDEIPPTAYGQIVALADKLDTLSGFWLIDERPTGSKDPYALRRAALGVIRIILETKTSISLSDYIHAALHLHTGVSANLEAQGRTEKEVVGDILSFIIDRLTVFLRDKGLRHDIVSASLTDQASNLVEIVARAEALAAFVNTPNGADLLAAYNRADGVLKKQQEQVSDDVETALFTDICETNLFTVLSQLSLTHETQSAEGLARYLGALSALKGPVDAFFETVLVNDPDPAIKKNRLGLLVKLVNCMNHVGDLSRLVKG